MTKKSRSSWLLSIAALISFALLGLTTLLSYQNRQLKSQLARPQSQPAASLPAPQPTASQNQIGDPLNWKTYTNQSYGFSFKYNYQRFHRALGYQTPAEELGIPANVQKDAILEKVEAYGI